MVEVLHIESEGHFGLEADSPFLKLTVAIGLFSRTHPARRGL